MKKLKIKKRSTQPIILLRLNYTKEDIDYIVNLYCNKGVPFLKYFKYMLVILIFLQFTVWISSLTIFLFIYCIVILVVIIFQKSILRKTMSYKIGKDIKIDLNHNIIINHRKKVKNIDNIHSFIDDNQNIIMFVKIAPLIKMPYLIKTSMYGNISNTILINYFS